VNDIQDAIQTAVGSSALTQVQQGEARSTSRCATSSPIAIRRSHCECPPAGSVGERVSLAQLTRVTTDDGAEEIYREGGQRYIAIKYSVRAAIWIDRGRSHRPRAA